MKIEILEPLGDGAFGDVWKARDELERTVAVKIIREANEGVADALAHARALARAAHPNIVKVLTIEKVQDPITGHQKDGVVMELLTGLTLEAHLSNGAQKIESVQRIGAGIISGLRHIHAQGLTHGDLHTENIMVCNGDVKIIDILYLNTLALLSSGSKQLRVRRDLMSLRLVLQQLLVNSDLTSKSATEFNNALEPDSGLDAIESAFGAIASLDETGQRSVSIEDVFARVVDPDFVEGEDYSDALLEQVPEGASLGILIRIADDGVYEYKHAHFVAGLWSQLDSRGRAEFLTHLSNVIDERLPKGKWWPPLRILAAIGPPNWKSLNKLVRLRAENMIAKDILAGYVDVYGIRAKKGGSLGTYASVFWRYFSNQETLAANLISMLRQSWYTQNYVASHFLKLIPKLAEATGCRKEFVEALRIAKRNDAKTLLTKLNLLPKDWQEEIGGS